MSLTLTRVMKKKKCKKQQLVLDLGQKSLRHFECAECGFVGNPTDAATHRKVCTSQGVLFSGGRVVVDARIRIVDTESPELEAVARVAGMGRTKRAFLAILKRRVIGCVFVETVSEAFRLKSIDPIVCYDDPVSVQLGVNTLWVHPSHRRKGIAKRLIDALRRYAFFGHVIPLSKLAFSHPTKDGFDFLQTLTPTLLLY